MTTEQAIRSNSFPTAPEFWPKPPAVVAGAVEAAWSPGQGHASPKAGAKGAESPVPVTTTCSSLHRDCKELRWQVSADVVNLSWRRFVRTYNVNETQELIPSPPEAGGRSAWFKSMLRHSGQP